MLMSLARVLPVFGWSWVGERREDKEVADALRALRKELDDGRMAAEHAAYWRDAYESSFRNSGIGEAHVALDGRFLKVNPALCRIVGLSEDELLAKTFDDITHPDDILADWDLYRRLQHGEFEHYRMLKRYWDFARGRWVPILLVACMAVKGGKNQHAVSKIIPLEMGLDDEAAEEFRRRAAVQ